MNLSDQVTSLEISKRLKEIGVKQEGNYSWLVASDGERLMINPVRSTYRYFDQYIAFTVAELGILLREIIEKIDSGDTIIDHTFSRMKPTLEWSGNMHEENSDTEADTRGLMLSYLLTLTKDI